jgi:NADPH:quinone reductase
VVFDPVGGDLFDASLRGVAPEARLLVIGFASGRVPEAAANLLLVKNVAVIGFNYGHYIGWGLRDERRRYAAEVQATVGKVLHAIADGTMPAPVTQRFPFPRWCEAIDTMMARRSVGKVILDIGAA